MARSSVASLPERSAPRDGKTPDPPTLRRLPGLKVWLFASVLVSLVAVFSFALGRELATNSQPAAPRPAVPTPRPALTPAEEAYALVLWPIHNRVKEMAIRMSLNGINFKLQTVDGPTFRAQIQAALTVYREADGQIRALQPPPSFQVEQEAYLGAVQLYRQAGTEMLRVLDDGNDEHLRTAFPLSQEGGLRLRQVGAVLWPTEYIPS